MRLTTHLYLLANADGCCLLNETFCDHSVQFRLFKSETEKSPRRLCNEALTPAVLSKDGSEDACSVFYGGETGATDQLTLGSPFDGKWDGWARPSCLLVKPSRLPRSRKRPSIPSFEGRRTCRPLVFVAHKIAQEDTASVSPCTLIPLLYPAPARCLRSLLPRSAFVGRDGFYIGRL